MKPFSEPYTWVMNRLPPHLLMASITACCGSGMLLFGYDQGVLGGLLTGDPFQRQFPMLTTNKTLQGFTVAVYELGCAAGAVFGFFFGDKLGRRQSIILGMFVLAIGAILQFMSYGLAQMLVGRIVTGLGNGLNTATIPVYQNETSKAHHRGRAVVIEMATNIFGVMLAYWVDYGLRNDQTDAQWRLPLALQVAFALITVSSIIFLPESPRWLAARGRITEARDVLWRLDGIPDEKARTISVDVQLNEILAAIETERATSKGFTTVFTMGEQRFFHRVLLGMGSQFMQQISGINLITYYAPVIFETSVGLSHDLSLLLSGLNGVAYFLSSLVPIPLIERVGRRKLLIFSVSGQAATMAILAGMTEDTGNTKKGIVAAVMLFVFNFFFASGLLSVPWLYPAEICPLAIRAQGAALATMTNWLFTFLVVMITPVAIDTIGYQIYIVWACTNFAFIFLVYFFYVETTGQTLEDLDLLFSQETSWFIGPKSAKLAREIRYARNAQRQEQIETGAANIEKSKAGIAGMRPLDFEHVEESSDKAL
ncbi:sugar porter family MFS transporter [Rhodotorula paludigena]|uniref:sugar porter family MFS transporter n=1 Tax=Rhodotorula paludigena TaxID=86838 RepID=UPI003174248D